MQVNQSEIKDLQAVLTLTLEPADYQDAVQKELKQIRQKANIPGFRPGMVPAGLVKKMYGKGVLAEVLNKTIGEELSKYISDNKLQVLGDPLPNNEQTPENDLDNQTTFTFAFDIAVAPEFDVKPTAKDKLTHYTIAVSDEMVENQVKSYAERFGEYSDTEVAQEGDVLRGTIKELKEDGIVKENAILSPLYVQDKEQAKLFDNAKKGDKITFNPLKAYGNEAEVASLLGIKKEEVAAHDGDFEFEITSISHHAPAAIDGELFAKVYGENNIKDEAEFRAKVKEEIAQNMEEDSKYKFGLDTKAAILKKMENLVFPDAFLKRWVLTTNEKITEEELEKDYPQMLESLKWSLAKDQLMKEYNIDVQKEDVEAYAKEVARMQFMQYGLMHIEDSYLDSYAQEMLKKEDQLRGIVERVAENKIYDAIKGIAKIEEKEISHEDFGKLFA